MRRPGLLFLSTCIFMGLGTAHAEQTAQQRCERVKLMAQGALQSCLKTSAAKVIVGNEDSSASCRERFAATLVRADKLAAKAHTACRYLDNNDGTVSDLNTGLVWEKKDDTCPGAHCVDDLFSVSESGTALDGTAFTTLLAALNGGVSNDSVGSPLPISGCFANHCDWRLPTVLELKTILLAPYPCDLGDVCIDPAFGPTKADLYWSATTLGGHLEQAWGVYFVNGGDLKFPKFVPAYVRAVRGGL